MQEETCSNRFWGHGAREAGSQLFWDCGTDVRRKGRRHPVPFPPCPLLGWEEERGETCQAGAGHGALGPGCYPFPVATCHPWRSSGASPVHKQSVSRIFLLRDLPLGGQVGMRGKDRAHLLTPWATCPTAQGPTARAPGPARGHCTDCRPLRTGWDFRRKQTRQKEQICFPEKFRKHGKKLKVTTFPRRGDDT